MKEAPVAASPASLKAALPEFVTFVIESRSDWDEEELRQALAVCKRAGWSWRRIVGFVWSTMCIEDGTPGDIKYAADPVATLLSRQVARRG